MQTDRASIPGSLIADIVRFSPFPEATRERVLDHLRIYSAAGQKNVCPSTVPNALALSGLHAEARYIITKLGHIDHDYSIAAHPGGVRRTHEKLTVIGNLELHGPTTIKDAFVTGDLTIRDGDLKYGRIFVGGEVRAPNSEPLHGAMIVKVSFDEADAQYAQALGGSFNLDPEAPASIKASHTGRARDLFRAP